MKRRFYSYGGALLAGIALLAAAPAAASVEAAAGTEPQPQSPQVTNIRSSVDSVPQVTIVPVQQPPVQVSNHITRYEVPGEGLNRVERRTLRAKQYAACIDSIVQSQNYLFFPATMQKMPDGTVQSVYADYYFFGMFADHVEVHLPIDRGVSHYIERLNFDSMSVSNYQLSRVQSGWMISCRIADGDAAYHACFMVSSATGETTLTLITPSVTMRYTGRLGERFGERR